LIVIEIKGREVTAYKASMRDICEAVYTLTMIIPPGKTTSYSSIARLLKIHPRVVAYCLSINKHPVIIPCHRVVYSDGGIGGFSLGGSHVKKKLLSLEGVEFLDGHVKEDYIMDLESSILSKTS